MSNGKFKLYVDSDFSSPYAMTAFVALTEKRVPFDIQKIDLAANECQKPGYSDLSLTCRVPMLSHDDFYLSESSAISEYLDDLLPEDNFVRLYPKDLREKSRARQIQAWLRSDLMPLREERSTAVIFFEPTKKPLSEQAQRSAAILFTATDALLKGGSQNLFDEWCIADIDLALMLNRLIMNGDEVPEKLSAYAQHQWQRPSVQLWMNRVRGG